MEHTGSSRTMTVSASDISYSLREVAFPAMKTDLVEHARRHSVNKTVMDRLSKIEDREYSSLDEVVKQVGKAA